MFIYETSIHRKNSARIKHYCMKILKDYRPYIKLRFISYTPIKIGCYLESRLNEYRFATLQKLCIKFLALVATLILGKRAAMYLTELGSIKMC